MSSGKFLPTNSECAGLRFSISHRDQPVKHVQINGMKIIFVSIYSTRLTVRYASIWSYPQETPNVQPMTTSAKRLLLSAGRKTLFSTSTLATSISLKCIMLQHSTFPNTVELRVWRRRQCFCCARCQTHRSQSHLS